LSNTDLVGFLLNSKWADLFTWRGKKKEKATNTTLPPLGKT